jgi:hypothetical protein
LQLQNNTYAISVSQSDGGKDQNEISPSQPVIPINLPPDHLLASPAQGRDSKVNVCQQREGVSSTGKKISSPVTFHKSIIGSNNKITRMIFRLLLRLQQKFQICVAKTKMR